MGATIVDHAIKAQLIALGVQAGDTVLVRAALQKFGGRGPKELLLLTLLDLLGPQGTLVSLAFTPATPLWRVARSPAFAPKTKSYAGGFPNSMLAHPEALRSTHPQCSFVAIGPGAEDILSGHGPAAPAYLPIRRLLDVEAKMLIIGCVDTSPGFTTAHWAEYQLGLHRRVMFRSMLGASRYLDESGHGHTFLRQDPGLCSLSFWKFYGPLVKAGVLKTGFVGQTHAVLTTAKECYAVEHALLASNPAFAACDGYLCAACNALRWDRLHRLPGFLAMRAWRSLRGR